MSNERYLPVLRSDAVDVCEECGDCGTPNVLCEPSRGRLRDFYGLRLTSDGFDCALPLAVDSHSHCSYACVYCFADNLISHRGATLKPLGQTRLNMMEGLFAGRGGRLMNIFRKALKYDRRNKNGYPCPIQLGAICDPGDHIERQQGWFLAFAEIVKTHRQPVRASTKGTTFALPEYLKVFAENPELWWVAFSIISPDDSMMARIDKRAPIPTERLKVMKALADVGVKTSLRFRPMLPGLSDATPNHPRAYRELILRARDAGAVAVSAEVAFVPGNRSRDVDQRWQRLEKILGVPLRALYAEFGPSEPCQRPPAAWTEDIMHAVREVAHDAGMVVGISDPVWKQLGDSGCCCGILPDDPVFGNWERENATRAMLEAQKTGDLVSFQDILPTWAPETQQSVLCNMGPGPLTVWKTRHVLWSDKLRQAWNDITTKRSTVNYFQGALRPEGVDQNGDLLYRFVGLERAYPERVPYWRVDPADGRRDVLSPALTQYPPGPWDSYDQTRGREG